MTMEGVDKVQGGLSLEVPHSSLKILRCMFQHPLNPQCAVTMTSCFLSNRAGLGSWWPPMASQPCSDNGAVGGLGTSYPTQATTFDRGINVVLKLYRLTQDLFCRSCACGRRYAQPRCNMYIKHRCNNGTCRTLVT